MAEKIDIVIDAKSNAEKEFNKTREAVKSLASSLPIIGVAFGGIAMAANLGAQKLSEIISKFKETIAASIAMSSAAKEIQGKFDVVFGDMAAQAGLWAIEFATSVGRSKTEVKEWMSRLQDTFVPLGYSREKAAELSKELVKLAVDVASFNNASDPETIQLFTSALVGNHEAVRRFGIVISEVSLKQEAARQGMKKNYDQLTDLEKVQLRYNIIMNSSKDAQGDAIRTIDNYANVVKRQNSAMRDSLELIGNQLTPALAELKKSMIGSYSEGAKIIVAVLDAIGLRNKTITQEITENWWKAGKAITSVAQLTERVTTVQKAITALLDPTNNVMREMETAMTMMQTFPFLGDKALAIQKQIASGNTQIVVDENTIVNVNQAVMAALKSEIDYYAEMTKKSGAMREAEKAGTLEEIELLKIKGQWQIQSRKGAEKGKTTDNIKKQLDQEKAAYELRSKLAESIPKADKEQKDREEWAEKERQFEQSNVQFLREYADEQEKIRKDTEEKIARHRDEIAKLYAEIGMATGAAMGKALVEGKAPLKEGFKALLTETIGYLEREILAARLATVIQGIFSGGISLVKNIPMLIGAEVMLAALKLQIQDWQMGTPYVRQAGPAMLHQGERVLGVTDNRMMVNELKNISSKLDRRQTGGNVTIQALDAQSFQEFMRRTGNNVLAYEYGAGRLNF